MLKDNLYTAIDKKNDEGFLEVTIQIDPNHSIFSGHFPSQPVLPGVCLIEILKEIVSEHLGMDYSLKEASNIKFLKVVDPLIDKKINFKINYIQKDKLLEIDVSSYLANGEINFKLKGIYSL